MMRSLFSGISGLKVHQTKMDVIGNNISNVNTVGFRSSSVNFTDVFYQTTQGASGPNASTGAAGTNAVQIGLGANVAAISVDLSGTGATQRTDRGMDIMINGDAFLIVQSSGSTYFTKSGALDVDANGTLYCTTNGASVLGWGVDSSGEIRKDTVSTLNLMSAENSYSDPAATTAVTLSGNVDKTDTTIQPTASGYTVAVSFYDKLGNLYTAKIKLLQDSEDTSTYDLSISDILGSDGKSVFTKLSADGKTYELNDMFSGDSADTITFGGLTLDLSNLAYNTTDGTIDSSTLVLGDDSTSLKLKFDGTTGAFSWVGTEAPAEDASANTLLLKLTNATPTTAGEEAVAAANSNNAFPAEGVTIDFSALTMYAGGGTSSVKPTRGDSNGDGAGNMAGSLSGFSIQTDGKIYGKYSNGDSKLLGQIAVATFANPSGLESVGNSMYAATMNSGDFDGIGEDISEIGSFSIGALEMSDVDLATEFTNMITTQRGFQANSRVITTSDTMLEELVNLKR